MKFKANDASTRNVSASNQPSAPSVPISVYRELAAELQATRAMVDSLNAKNQDLTVQNHKLRQEIHRFAQTAIALQTIVEPPQVPVSPVNGSEHSSASNRTAGRTRIQPEARLEPTLEEAAAATRIAAQLRATDPNAMFTQVLTEEPVVSSLPSERHSRDLGGLWLMLTIVLIMVTAFGAGFFVVRPLLPSSK
jgi:hypothetical protein